LNLPGLVLSVVPGRNSTRNCSGSISINSCLCNKVAVCDTQYHICDIVTR